MTVKELIEALQKFEDKEMNIEVPVRVSTRAYPVVYVGTNEEEGMVHMPEYSPYHTVRLTISMPDDVTISRKKKG